MELRSYQLEAVERAYEAWNTGKRSTLFVCPTGGGKTIVFAEIIRRHLKAGGVRALVITDRSWLVTQARDRIQDHASVEVGVEMAAQRVDRAAIPHVVCASVQSLWRRLEQFDSFAFDLIVVDEADLALAPTYRLIFSHFTKSKIFGCTATPERGDAMALGELFESVCGDIDIRDLIDVGYLCSVRQHTVRVLDLSRVKMGDDDLDEASLDRILSEEKHLHEVVKPTLELSEDRPTLVFGVTVRHAELLAALFNRYRPGSARSIHGKMKHATRAELVRGFLARDFQFFCNCNLVMRGVDIPPIACVAMARPTQSRTIYVQGLGRGTRIAEGKKDLLVLDFTDGATSFSLVNSIDVLGGKSSKEEKERARELVDENPGMDVSGALERAREELAADASMRERVRAKVKYKTREVAVHDPIDWSRQPLGRMTDAALAQKLGISVNTIHSARKRLGIRAFRVWPVVDWDAQPLGKMTDCDLAKLLGVSQTAVSAQRAKRDIPPFGRNDIDWDGVPFGKEHDRAIAKRLGVTAAVVGAERKRRGITPCPGQGVKVDNIDWSKQPLGKESDRQIAIRLGTDHRVVARARVSLGIAEYPRTMQKRKDIDWDAQPFGEVNDAEIARQLGCDTAAVYHQRIKRGIAAVPRKYDINWDAQPLGKFPDEEIANQLGTSSSLVNFRRKERGIPSFYESMRAAKDEV